MGTPQIGVGYVASNQNQKEVTINAGFDSLDNASNALLSLDCTGGGTITLTAPQYTGNGMLLLVGSPGAGFTIHVPNTLRAFMVHNTSGQTASLRATGGGPTVTLNSGTAGIIFNEGTSLELIAEAGVTAFAALTDVALSGLADKDQLIWDNAAGKWKNFRARYMVACAALSGVVTSNQLLLLHKFSKAVTIPANFGSYQGHNSEAGGTDIATASTVINVDKATAAAPNTFSNVGTITIGAGGVAATFATSGGAAVAFAQGDVLRIQGPSVADATFANFYSTLVGFET